MEGLFRESLFARARWLGQLLVFFLLPLPLFAGGKPATMLVNVADTRDLEPGITLFVAQLYNESHYLFALFCIVLMASLGLALGLLADRIFILLGVHLGRLSHHE